MIDWVAKSVFELFAGGSAQDKDRAQEQLKPVLERRLQPCLELWQEVWQFADNGLQKGQANQAQADDDIRRLSQRVDSFLHDYGALISVPCLVALSRFQNSLRDIDPDSDEFTRQVKVRELHKQLFPSPEKDAKGKVVGQNPGLLMLLRDDIGSNARAASSTLK
jgi:hypothetical protein